MGEDKHNGNYSQGSRWLHVRRGVGCGQGVRCLRWPQVMVKDHKVFGPEVGLGAVGGSGRLPAM